MVGDLEINRAERRVRRGGVEAHLTPTEFDLLVHLARRPRAVLPRERLLAEVWGWADASGTRTVDSHVKALRRKLGADLIRTVHGVGYALDGPTAMNALTGLRRGGLGWLPSGCPGRSTRSARSRSSSAAAGRSPARPRSATSGTASAGSPPGTSAIAIGLALLTTQLLAHGMTSPLREMTRGRARDGPRRLHAGGSGPRRATRSASWPTRST